MDVPAHLRFLTVKKRTSAELIIDKSRFICTICRVSSEAEARDFIASLKKHYWDANHNCSAFIVGDRSQIQRSADDGEPAGTAGIPMLEVLKKRNLTHTAAVVTRYFGGVKLGAGGLIRAYGKSVSAAAEQAGLLAVLEMSVVCVQVDYAALQKIESAIGKTSYTLCGTEYADSVKLKIGCAPAEIPLLETWLLNLANGKATFCGSEITLIEKEQRRPLDSF